MRRESIHRSTGTIATAAALVLLARMRALAVFALALGFMTRSIGRWVLAASVAPGADMLSGKAGLARVQLGY